MAYFTLLKFFRLSILGATGLQFYYKDLVENAWPAIGNMLVAVKEFCIE